jgi:molybdate transport repressor ModE-like protein
MIRVTAKAGLHVTDRSGQEFALDEVARILEAIHRHGTLTAGAREVGLSYRYAWGLMRDVETRLGGSLTTGARGRGSVLSPLGEKLLWASHMLEERLGTNLETLASEIAVELNRVLSDDGVGTVRIRASHGYAVAALISALYARAIPVDLKYRENAEALGALAARECDLAGFYVPIGEFRSVVSALYRRWLDPARHQLIYLTRRQQGLFLPAGNPKGITGLHDLARVDLRVVNRQPGSGTRVLLDLLLAKAGVDATRINNSASTELTHSALAAFVASGMADVGFGVQPAATQFGLDFIPVAEEDYFFAYERDAMRQAPLSIINDILNDPRYQDTVRKLAGYDPAQCGKQMDVDSGLAGAF